MKRTFVFALILSAFGLLLAACGTPSAPNITATALLPPNAPASNSANASTCATNNHAPLDTFRPDSIAKLTASPKPKLIEFYAVW